MNNSIHPLTVLGSAMFCAMTPIANRLMPMPVAPRNMSGLRPHLSTLAIATTVDNALAPPMTICCSIPASTPVEALMFLNMVVPK